MGDLKGFAGETCWGTVRALSQQSDSDSWEVAWGYLVAQYARPLEAFARGILDRLAARGLAVLDPATVVSDFLADCVANDWLARADEKLGRFRVFVRTLLARHIKDRVFKERAQKRMPEGGPPQSVDDLAGLVGYADSAELADVLDAEWAKQLMRSAVARLEERSRDSALIMEAILAEGEPDRGLLAERLGKKRSQMALKMLRARQHFAQALWDELKQTCSNTHELQLERAAMAPWLEKYLDRESARSFFEMPAP